MNDTIAAISTAFGEAAIAVLRLSGVRAVEIAGAVFRGKKGAAELTPRFAHFGSIFDGDRRLDDVLLTVFRAPASYTGEDVAEISCHGGVLVSRRILELLLRAGARSAEPGEFTQRAFLNRKLDLTQAEAVMDVISAQTDLALRAANEQLEGRLGARIRELRTAVLDTLAQVEAYIDFPDEDISPETGAALRGRIESALADVGALLATAGQGKVLREGLRTVIFGAPNVGKSSLLNRLLGYERAIVSHHPGTTRDVLEETINLRGIPVRLMDTAGIRDSTCELEQAGMERTRQAMERADLVLHLVDASSDAAMWSPMWSQRLVGPAGGKAEAAGSSTTALGDPTQAEITSAEPTSRRRHIEMLVLNKADLGIHVSWQARGGIEISALTGEGFETLLGAIVGAARGGAAKGDWSVAINARHQSCLETARDFLDAALGAFDQALSPEFIAEELRAAMDAIGDIVGRADTDELLGVIFGQFCIGK
ncbi:MAG: tRNA uridine-5-carboxymethylaminomethyl(34) synthesis GTPase MnmE [Chthoniobacteraceae bacterium]